jgi:hypothetical protein
MEKHFVTYNQALALKELGFDEPCFGAYDTHQGDDWILNIQSNYYYRQFSVDSLSDYPNMQTNRINYKIKVVRTAITLWVLVLYISV